MTRILVVGGVAAGMSAAARARRGIKDAEIVVFEKTGIVSFGACGLPYFAGGWFDDPDFMIARTAAQLAESGIDVRLFHEALSIDPSRKTLRVRNLRTGEERDEPYDRLMVASGARPIRPPFPGRDLGNIHTLTKLPDGQAVRKALEDPAVRDVVIIGAGFIGVEAVEACLHRGKDVRLIQLDERILIDAFDREVTDLLQKELVEKGVRLHVAERVTGFEGGAAGGEGAAAAASGAAALSGAAAQPGAGALAGAAAPSGAPGRSAPGAVVRRVVTDKGSYQADLVIVAVGVRPATEFLAGSGIKTLPNGAVIVDGAGRTNVADVFAAGDCAAVPLLADGSPAYTPLATGANKLGRVVGDGLAGKDARYPGSLGSACIKVLDLEAGRTGLSETDAARRGIACKTVWVQDKDHANYWPDQKDIAIKLVYEPETRRILGGQVVGGRGAVLRTDVLAAAVAAGFTTDRLGMLDLCYAPPFARTWDALNVAGNVAK